MAYQTQGSRVMLALVVGVLIGAAAIGAFYVGIVKLTDGRAAAFESWPLFGYGFALGFQAWAIGLAAVAAPVWWLLHRAGWRGPLTAVATGTILTFVICMALGLSDLAPALRLMEISLVLTLLGAGVALVIWRIAYRRVAT